MEMCQQIYGWQISDSGNYTFFGVCWAMGISLPMMTGEIGGLLEIQKEKIQAYKQL